jgi:hypothetical protein
MNERIRELLTQAGVGDNWNEADWYSLSPKMVEKFAELIVQECAENFAKVWYEQGLDIRGAELDKFMKRFDEHFGVE